MTIERRRGYSPDFKREAVALVNEGTQSCAEVDRLMELPRGTTAEWAKVARQDAAQAFPGHGRRKADDEEKRRLQQRVRELEQENAILKKVMDLVAQAKTSASSS